MRQLSPPVSRRRKTYRRRRILVAAAVLLALSFLAFAVAHRIVAGRRDPDASAGPDDADLPEPSAPAYDYGAPVPESRIITLRYFDDAVFIGNSRTQGLILFNNLSNVTAYCTQGLSLGGVFDAEFKTPGGSVRPLPQAVRETDCGKIYVMLGMNDMGYPDENTFGERYAALVDALKEAKPDAVLYVQSILPITLLKEQSPGNAFFTMARISRYNDQLKALCREKKVYYLDVSSGVIDDSGYLPDEAAGDGVHLTPRYCGIWLDYLRSHVILPPDYDGEFDIPAPAGPDSVVSGEYPPTSEATDVTDFT